LEPDSACYSLALSKLGDGIKRLTIQLGKNLQCGTLSVLSRCICLDLLAALTLRNTILNGRLHGLERFLLFFLASRRAPRHRFGELVFSLAKQPLKEVHLDRDRFVSDHFFA